MRQATAARKTKETDIAITLNLDGEGRGEIVSGVGFLNHMLVLLAVHGGFDLTVRATGDTEVDFHHTTEDIGIVLGQAFRAALPGEGRGIMRYGNMTVPMDESLVLVSLDISGRAYLKYDMPLSVQKVGEFDTELVEDFLLAFCRAFSLTLHVKQIYGGNTHHSIEALFKALGRALKQAVAVDPQNPDTIPSSKGVLL